MSDPRESRIRFTLQNRFPAGYYAFEVRVLDARGRASAFIHGGKFEIGHLLGDADGNGCVELNDVVVLLGVLYQGMR